MPWADIIIALSILLAAFIGYNVGLLRAIRGFVSNFIGIIAGWILTPIAQAWLQTRFGVETFLAGFIRSRLPESLETIIRGAAQSARTLQEFQELLLTLLPRDISQYVERSMQSVLQTVPSPDQAINALTAEIARNIIWAFLFFLVYVIVSIFVKGFLNLIIVRGDGKSLIGVVDGLLGMTALTLIFVVVLIGISGFVFPIALMSKPDGNLASFYPHLLQSSIFNWMVRIYQLYLVPWMG